MENEWTIEISESEKKILELAERDIENGSYVPHSQVMEELDEYLSNNQEV